MKILPFAKKKKVTVSKQKKKTWDMFSKYIRYRDALKTTGALVNCVCFTCGRLYEVKVMQAGHFISGRHPSVLFDERGVNAQCYHCNIGLKGNSLVYFRKMQKLWGEKVIEELEVLDRENHQFSVPELEDLYNVFKTKVNYMEAL